MRSNSLISIIIPVYKVEKYLRKCVDSVINQTYKNLEIILVDDGSPDNCPQICDEYASKDKRIKVIHKPNGGVSSARNAGLDIAKGEFIQFVDSDDYIGENLTFDLYSSIMQFNTDIAISGLTIIRDKKIKIVKGQQGFYDFLNDRKTTFWKLYNSRLIETPINKLYRRQLIKSGFPLNQVYGEDCIFNLNYLDKVKSISVVENSDYFYINNLSSAMNTKRKDFFNIASVVVNRIIEFVDKFEIDTNNGLGKIILDYLLYCIANEIRCYRKDKKLLKQNIAKMCEGKNVQRAISEQYKITEPIFYILSRLIKAKSYNLIIFISTIFMSKR